MSIRFVDLMFSEKNKPTLADRQDFAVRKRRPIWQSLAVLFAAVLLISVTLSGVVKDSVVFGQMLFVILLWLGVYVVFSLQRAYDLVLATEFQNALFSAAISHSNKFCIIIKNDDSVAYIDRAMQEMFPDFYKGSRRSIDILLEMGNVSIVERKMIFTALERRVRDSVVFDITDHRKQVRRIIMSIEPIARPKGFMLMRGHEFVEKRLLGPQVPSDNKTQIFNKTSLNLFSYIMDSMDVGTYMFDLFGNITYANLTLEQLLHFEENEMSDSNLALKNIIAQTGLNVAVDEMKNFDGEVTLLRKIGGSIKAKLHQKAMYDEQGSIIGYVGMVHIIGDKAAAHNSPKNGSDSW